MRTSGHTRAKHQPTQFEKDWAVLGQTFSSVATDIRRLGASLTAFESALSSALGSHAERERDGITSRVQSAETSVGAAASSVERKHQDRQRVFVAARELSKMLSVSQGTLWRWVKLGKFPAPMKMGPRCTRWKMEDVNIALQRLRDES